MVKSLLPSPSPRHPFLLLGNNHTILESFYSYSATCKLTNVYVLPTLYMHTVIFFFLNLGVQPVNNVVIVSGGQQRDSAIHIHVSILLQTPLPSRLPQNTEQSSLCCTVGPCWLSILNIAVYSITLLKQKYLLVIGYCFQLLFCFCAHLHSKSS